MFHIKSGKHPGKHPHKTQDQVPVSTHVPQTQATYNSVAPVSAQVNPTPDPTGEYNG